MEDSITNIFIENSFPRRGPYYRLRPFDVAYVSSFDNLTLNPKMLDVLSALKHTDDKHPEFSQEVFPSEDLYVVWIGSIKALLANLETTYTFTFPDQSFENDIAIIMESNNFTDRVERASKRIALSLSYAYYSSGLITMLDLPKFASGLYAYLQHEISEQRTLYFLKANPTLENVLHNYINLSYHEDL